MQALRLDVPFLKRLRKTLWLRPASPSRRREEQARSQAANRARRHAIALDAANLALEPRGRASSQAARR